VGLGAGGLGAIAGSEDFEATGVGGAGDCEAPILGGTSDAGIEGVAGETSGGAGPLVGAGVGEGAGAGRIGLGAGPLEAARWIIVGRPPVLLLLEALLGVGDAALFRDAGGSEGSLNVGVGGAPV